MASERIHGEYLRKFEESDGTVADFISCFKLGRRVFLKEYDQTLPVEVGELLYDKETYLMRTITIAGVPMRFKFIKRQSETEPEEESRYFIEAMRNTHDNL